MRLFPFLFTVLFALDSPVHALASAAAAKALKDHSAAAIGLFNNMRTPAALIGGSLVPLGILSAPSVDKEKDSKAVTIMKKANIIIGVTSLLSEVLAVIYSSIAINKLAEVESPLTTGSAELIAQHYELAWLGTNVHFLLGLLGQAFIVGSRAYISAGNMALGKATLGFAFAAIFKSLTVVNRGIEMGHGSTSALDGSVSKGRFASNFGMLIVRYLTLVTKDAGFCSVAALVAGCFAMYETFKVLLSDNKEA